MATDSQNNSTLRRNDPAIAAEDARRFLTDPNTTRVMEAMRAELVRAIETSPSDGSDGDQRRQLEMNRMLRTLARMRSGMSIKTQLQDLRLAGFQSVDPDAKTTDEAKN